MTLARLQPSPAMVVALVALSVALGGVGYAATVLPAASGTYHTIYFASPTVKAALGGWLGPPPAELTVESPVAASPADFGSGGPGILKGVVGPESVVEPVAGAGLMLTPL